MRLKFVGRGEWGAKKPLGYTVPVRRDVRSPAEFVLLTYTGTTSCADFDSCKADVLELQNYHMHRHMLYDIAYNFLIGADGLVFNGRGWALEADRPAKYSFLKGLAIDIAFIGNYKDYKPPWSMIQAAMEVVDLGVSQKEIHPEYRILSYMDEETTNTARRKIEKRIRRAALAEARRVARLSQKQT